MYHACDCLDFLVIALVHWPRLQQEQRERPVFCMKREQCDGEYIRNLIARALNELFRTTRTHVLLLVANNVAVRIPLFDARSKRCLLEKEHQCTLCGEQCNKIVQWGGPLSHHMEALLYA